MKKKCKKCGIEKELTVENFERQKGMKDGFRNTCKECRNKRRRELYKKREGRWWRQEEIEILLEVYETTSNKDISDKYLPNRTPEQIGMYAREKLGLKKAKIKKDKIKKDKIKKVKSDKPNKSENKRAKWSEEEELLLKQVYGNHSNEDIKELYFPDKTLNMINARARKLGLYKSEEYMFDLRMSNLEKINIEKTNNPKRSRVIVYCSECGKEIEVIPSKLKTQKRFYCSKECLRLGRQKFNSGENNPNYNNGKAWSKEMREEASKRAVKRLNERNFNFTNTKPQMIINEILDKKSISFTNEYDCVLYSIDNYLTDYNLMIEVQGNFFHCNPIMNLPNNRKEEILKKDKEKHKYIKEVYNIEILYLWEKDIIEDIEKCERIIVEYIKNNGILQNYHSYNYEIVNGTLQLKEELTDIGY